MKHARAWVATRYPGALTIEAKPRISWIPMKGGERRPISVEEDIWGVFDLAVFPMGGRVELLQITAPSGVSARKKKISDWVHGSGIEERGNLAILPMWLGEIRLLAWVPRKHFRQWVWFWPEQKWVEGPVLLAPLPRKSPPNLLPPPG